MRRERGRLWFQMIVAAVAIAVIALVVSVIARGREVPDGPQPVAWNQQACAHCRMLVGEPAHAAQLITAGGDVLFFDDPGCLMTYLDQHAVAIHRLWFHDRASERWLGADDAGFVPGATTPMGFGLAATDRTTPGALTLEQARRRVRQPADGAQP